MHDPDFDKPSGPLLGDRAVACMCGTVLALALALLGAWCWMFSAHPAEAMRVLEMASVVGIAGLILASVAWLAVRGL